MNRSAAGGFLAAALLASHGAQAQVGNLRISEVDPHNNEVEILNTGDAFTASASFPFCHRFIYNASIPGGTTFDAGERLLFTVPFLGAADSDLWLYSTPFFDSADFIVHGLKWGPQPNVGRTGLAASGGLWPSASAFAPAPPAGMTLAWNGYGFAPADWYINETPSLGQPDVTQPGTVPNRLRFPGATQTFEDMPLGDEVFAIDGWPVVDTSEPGLFSVRAVNDVLGVAAPRPGSNSTRWLRIRDRDGADEQNRFYTNPVSTPGGQNYRWTFYVNLEQTPPGGDDAKPRFTIQHADTDFANAWGIQFTDQGADLVVTGIGGPDASAPLYPLSGSTDIGQWVKVELAGR